MKLLIHTIALNRADLLKQMIDSIETKRDDIEITMLMHKVSTDKTIEEYFKDYEWHAAATPLPWAESGNGIDCGIFLKDYGYNIGFAHCVNDALEFGFEGHEYDAILFANSDMKFGPGDIDKMISFHLQKPDKLITICGTHGKHKDKWEGMALSHGFACSLLPRKMFEEVGYFDENFFPAYNEDCDYFTRVWHHRGVGPIRSGYDKISSKDSPLVECVRSGNTHHEGSSVIYSDSRLMQLNKETHGQNNRYYLAKHGGINDHEVYETPFDEGISLRIEKEDRHNPYAELWDRSKEKEKYYKLLK